MLSSRSVAKTGLPLLMAVLSLAEDLIFKQTVLLVLSTIFFLSRLIQQRTNRWTSSSEAILIYSSVLVTVLIVLPYFGIQQNRTSIMTMIYLAFVVTAIGSVYTYKESKYDNRRISQAVGLLGSIFLFILILVVSN